MLVRKVKASLELWAHLTGKIGDHEEYEKYRYGMAKSVWAEMQRTDSRECRSCHRDDAWDEEAMSDKAKSRHARGKNEGLTCIDGHYGIAHKEPEGPGPQEMRAMARTGKQ